MFHSRLLGWLGLMFVVLGCLIFFDFFQLWGRNQSIMNTTSTAPWHFPIGAEMRLGGWGDWNDKREKLCKFSIEQWSTLWLVVGCFTRGEYTTQLYGDSMGLKLSYCKDPYWSQPTSFHGMSQGICFHCSFGRCSFSVRSPCYIISCYIFGLLSVTRLMAGSLHELRDRFFPFQATGVGFIYLLILASCNDLYRLGAKSFAVAVWGQATRHKVYGLRLYATYSGLTMFYSVW